MRAHGCGAPHRALESQESKRQLKADHAEACSVKDAGMKVQAQAIIANEATLAEVQRQVRRFS